MILSCLMVASISTQFVSSLFLTDYLMVSLVHFSILVACTMPQMKILAVVVGKSNACMMSSAHYHKTNICC